MLKLAIFLLLTLCGHHAMLDGIFKSPILVTSEKYWYPVEDSVEIYCKTTDEAYGDLYFSDLKPTVPLNSTQSSVKAVGKNIILLQLNNVTAGKYNYICQSNKTRGELFDIGIASFEVGYPPEIKNIQFESLDLKQLSVLMIPKTNGSNDYWKTTWNLGENIRGDPMSDKCLCLNASQSCLCEDPFHCTISGESCFHRNRIYQFNILGSNHFGLLNKTYSIKPTIEMVKLEKLKNLETFVGVSSLRLSWSWKLQDLYPSNVVECKVSYKLQNGERNSYLIVSNETTFKNLVHDTLALQCKFQASNYWSDVITVNKRISSSGSNIDIENLKIIDVTDSDAIFSWKSPPVALNILDYHITYKAENDPEESTPRLQFKLKNLNSSTHYALTAALWNNNGSPRQKIIQFTTKKTDHCSLLKLTPLSNTLLHVNWTYPARKLIHFITFEKTYFLASQKEFTLEVPCPKDDVPLKLGVQVFSELVNGMLNTCKMNIKEVTMCQNRVFQTYNINDLPHKGPNVSDSK